MAADALGRPSFTVQDLIDEHLHEDHVGGSQRVVVGELLVAEAHAAAAAIELKGLEFEKVDMNYGSHNEEMEAIYGKGAKTVPGMVVDGDRPFSFRRTQLVEALLDEGFQFQRQVGGQQRRFLVALVDLRRRGGGAGVRPLAGHHLV